MMPNMKVSTFCKGWGCPFMNPARSPFRSILLHPQISPVQTWESKDEKHPSFHKQCLNNLLLFNQRQMNLQTENPGVQEEFVNQSCQHRPLLPQRSFCHLHSLNSIHLPQNSCHLLAFPIGTGAKSFSKTLSHLCFYISF